MNAPTLAKRCIESAELRIAVEGLVKEITGGQTVGMVMIFTSNTDDSSYDVEMQTNITNRELLAQLLQGAVIKVRAGPADEALDPVKKH